ncbi:DDE family transposase [Cereibacter azotoformans]|uniref:DDE family transposase n=1 Tax=Cereibacter azotoformans TaxID=43057 RepID=A0A2T5JSQ0_9RHOB|nr:DDE family transposase [Cereibacter azotoformans]
MAPAAPRKPTNDAEASCTAVTQPTVRFVSVKTEAQQAVLMSHRARDFLVRQLTQPGKPQSRRRIHGRTRPVAEDADPLVTREPSIHGPRTMANALRRRGSLLVWLDKEMAWLAPRQGRPGRPPVFSEAAIQVCLSIKGEGRPERSCGPFSALNGRSPGSGRRLGRPRGWWPASCAWPVSTGRFRTVPPCAGGRSPWPSTPVPPRRRPAEPAHGQPRDHLPWVRQDRGAVMRGDRERSSGSFRLRMRKIAEQSNGRSAGTGRRVRLRRQRRNSLHFAHEFRRAAVTSSEPTGGVHDQHSEDPCEPMPPDAPPAGTARHAGERSAQMQPSATPPTAATSTTLQGGAFQAISSTKQTSARVKSRRSPMALVKTGE